MTSLEGYLPSPGWYPLAYSVKVLLVAAVAWTYRSTWSDLRPVPSLPVLTLATMVGLIVFSLWVKLEGWYPALGFLGSRTGFDPSTSKPAGNGRSSPSGSSGWSSWFRSLRSCSGGLF